MKVELYHGTNYENIQSILDNGLKGGNNSKGGTHGQFTTPSLYLAVREHVAKKYGSIIIITITKEQLEKLGARYINDGLGDECVVIESENDDFDEILLSPDYLSCLEWDHEMGFCEEDCEFCLDN